MNPPFTARGEKSIRSKLLTWSLFGALLASVGVFSRAASGTSASPRPPAESVSVSYTFQAPVVERLGEYDRVILDGLSSHGEPGAPVLPLQTARILLPPGTTVQDVQVDPADRVVLDGVYNVAPGQALAPTGSEPGEPTPPDPAIYASAEPYPGDLYARVSVQGQGGYNILILNLHPVQYVPRTGQLLYYPRFTVTVKTTSGREGAAPRGLSGGLPRDEARVRKLVDNPQIVDSYPAPVSPNLGGASTTSLVSPDDPCDYVVITSAALSDTFRSLVDWKTSKGLASCIYTTDAIYADYAGDDEAEKVRNFIVDAYTTWAPTAHPLQYVLLGGDTEVIPVRLVYVQYGGYSTWMPVDMYYAGLDGDWDADGDGQYGEPAGEGTAGEEVDFFADVYVGRFPVETAAEAASAISKTLRYEQHPTADYLDRALWLGRQLDDWTWGGDSKDQVSNLIPQYNVTALYSRDGTYSTGQVIDKINDGVHLVNFDGHGNWNCCPLYRSQVSDLTNDDPLFFYNLGCNTARFDGSGDEAVAEYYIFTDHGAFAYVGNTRYGWYSPGSTNGPGNQLDRLFFDYAVNTEHRSIGEALQTAKEDYYPGHRWSILTLTLLGDPETALVTEFPEPVANISSPLGGRTIKHSVDIVGTARAGDATGATFDHYVVEYGAGSSPSAWTQIALTSTVPVTDDVLATWDTTVLVDATYTLRLRVEDDAGATSSHRHILETDNLYITAPPEDELIQGGDALTITGTALGTDFTAYEVAYGRGTSPSSWTVITTSTSPVTDSVLAVWDLSTLTEADDYTIRLTRHGTAHNSSTQVTVYIDPAWQAGWPQPTYYRAVAPTIAAGDLDGDGDLEVVAAVSRHDGSSGYVHAWHHDGSLVDGWPRYATGNWISAPALADVDRDGDLEVLVGTYGKKVYAWHHDGREVAGWPQDTGGEVFGAPSVADLNRDGILEIVVAALDGYAYAWHYDGAAVTGWPKEAGGDLYASPALGDLDGDGHLEVVAARSSAVYAWNDDGTAAAGWPISATAIASDVVGSPAMGDVDDDGDMEVVLAAGEAVYAWHHDGTSVAPWPQSVSGKIKSSPALGDLEGDGDLEIVVGSDQVYAWHDDGTPVAGWPVTPTAHTNSSPVLGDVTGDGQIDVVIGAGDGDDHVYAWQSDGSALPGWPRFVPAFGGSGDYHERLASPILVDLDQDGDVEVAIGAETHVFVFDWPAAYSAGDVAWPIFQHDLSFSGTYTDELNLPPFVRDVWARPGYVAPGKTVTITARVTDENGVSSVTAEIESPDETMLATLTLYDDGAHGDGAAGDGVYGRFWTTPGDKQNYLVDVAAVDALGHSCVHDNAGSFTSLDVAYVQYNAFTINREDMAPNGVVNPGEYVEGALTLENIGVLGAAGVTATVSTDDVCILWYRTMSMTFGSINAGDTAVSGDYDFYFYVASDCTHDHVAAFDLDIYDTAGSHWVDSFELTVIDNVGPYVHSADALPRYVEAGQLVTITAFVQDSSGVRSAQAVIESPDETERTTLALYDDGLHGDLGAGDGTYANAWVTDDTPRTYRVDFVTEDELGNVGSYDNVTEFTTQPFSRTADILLVADNGGISTDGFRAYYTGALDAFGASYDVWDTYWYGAVTSETLQAYTSDTVIWAAPNWGYLYQTSVQEALGAYLDAGGKLFITGQNVGMTCGATDFYADYLHASYEADNAGSWSLGGTSGDPIGDGLQLTISGGDGADNQVSPEEIAPLSPATTVFTYANGTSSAGAIRVDAGDYRVVYFGFGFEAIDNAQDRTTVMYRVLDWLTGGIVPSVDFTAAPLSGPCPLTAAMTGTVTGMLEPYTTTWDFADGVVQAAAPLTVTHVFSQAGTYDVTMTVENAASVASATHPIVVSAPPVYDVQLDPTALTKSTAAGHAISAVFTVTNGGSAPDTFDLSLNGNAWSTTVTPTQVGPSAPGASSPVTVAVSAPSTALPGQADTVTITARSQGDGGRTTQAMLTTSVKAYVFLPSVLR